MAMKDHPLRHVWGNMVQRCTNPNRPDFVWYGGKGITVCEKWRSFEGWLEDMPERPDGSTLERIETSKGYEPGNVRWATAKEQANNRSTNVFYEIDGETKTLAEWAEHYGLDATGYKRAHERIKNGWDPQRALETPPRIGRWKR